MGLPRRASVTCDAGEVAARDPSALDLQEGLPAARDSRGCKRWPRHLRLKAGERLVWGRCKATNQCEYCAVLASVEAAEMLALDALQGDAPGTLVVTTTRTATVDVSGFQRAREALVRAIRREWPHVEYACLVEWTTGYGERSGGARRPHWNWMLKGLTTRDHSRLRAIVAEHWCGRVDAEPHAQHVGEIYAAGGLTRYLAMHFLKASQAPPRGFTGQRFNCSRGYFGSSTRREAREAARRSLQSKRALWRALQAGHQGDEAELVAELDVAAAEGVEWQLVEVMESTGGLVLATREVGGLVRVRGARIVLPSGMGTSALAAALTPSASGRAGAARPPERGRL